MGVGARTALVLAALSCADAPAKTTAEEAARLGRDLTPVGAERAANADGSISAWSGGLIGPPGCFQPGGRYCNPYAEDQPLYSITRANLDPYRGMLSAGQLEMFNRHEDYQLDVYATRRSFANPPFIYEATRKNATSAELDGGGESLKGAVTGVPFPIPNKGSEVIWNHRLRYRGAGMQRWNSQLAVTAGGEFSLSKFREDVKFNYSRPGVTPEQLGNVICYFLQLATEPQRLAGDMLLVHETLDPVREARRSWQYHPGQRRLRRAPNVGYDAPAAGADGLRSVDQADSFNGAMDRYDWKLIGKKEMIVPANSYALHSDRLKYADIVRKGHINQSLARYERRRVWQVDAVLRKNSIHQYRKRVFYVDEDGWQIRLVDLYDAQNQLWRLQEAHSVVAYDKPYELPVCETVYDLQSGRYLAQALNNEDAETVSKEYEETYFDPSNVSKLAAQ